MSAPGAASKDEDEIPPPQRPPSPPLHTTFPVRGVHPPSFPAFRPRDVRHQSAYGMTRVAWSCDGRRLAAVGMDKVTRVFSPEKSMEMRSATQFTGGHLDDVDYVSWNPTHPELFCTSSQKDRRIVFWDARQSRPTQTISLKSSPLQTAYAPDGKTLLYITNAFPSPFLYFLQYGKDGEDAKDAWRQIETEPMTASYAIWNHVGDGLILTRNSEHSLRVVDYPSFNVRETPAAHVGGCVAVALDPRGRYMATGGHDSIVDIFDLSEWICVRTISTCDNSITDVSFSHDGEYIAIANTGMYIDICATETGAPLHRVPALASSPVVTWHPSKYIIAYCGQTKVRDGAPSMAVISLFGPGL